MDRRKFAGALAMSVLGSAGCVATRQRTVEASAQTPTIETGYRAYLVAAEPRDDIEITPDVHAAMQALRVALGSNSSAEVIVDSNSRLDAVAGRTLVEAINTAQGGAIELGHAPMLLITPEQPSLPLNAGEVGIALMFEVQSGEELARLVNAVAAEVRAGVAAEVRAQVTMGSRYRVPRCTFWQQVHNGIASNVPAGSVVGHVFAVQSCA